MTEIKICGITGIADALQAVACGADALGFIFYGQSPRYIAPAAAAEIIARLPGAICKVGVFVNEAAARVKQTAAACGLDMIQLHGDETAAYCAEFHPAALGTVRPRAVDINSGVEAAPGKKDAEKMKEIIRIIRGEETGEGHEPIFAVRPQRTHPGTHNDAFAAR